jgi:hypothetical protein
VESVVVYYEFLPLSAASPPDHFSTKSAKITELSIRQALKSSIIKHGRWIFHIPAVALQILPEPVPTTIVTCNNSGRCP